MTFTHSASMRARKQRSKAYSRGSRKSIGPIEVCLYNAGSNVNKPLLDTTEKLFFKAWELACYGGFLVGREAARVMLPRGRGTIFFTGATASVRGGSGVCGIFISEVRTSSSGPGDGARAWTEEHSRRASPDRRRRG